MSNERIRQLATRLRILMGASADSPAHVNVEKLMQELETEHAIERDQLRARLERADELLRQVARGTNAHPFCPGCGKHRELTHGSWCPIMKYLAPASSPTTEAVHPPILDLMEAVKKALAPRTGPADPGSVPASAQGTTMAIRSPEETRQVLLGGLAAGRIHLRLDDLDKRVSALSERVVHLGQCRSNYCSHGAHGPAAPPQPAPVERHAFVLDARDTEVIERSQRCAVIGCFGQPRSAAVHGEGAAPTLGHAFECICAGSFAVSNDHRCGAYCKYCGRPRSAHESKETP